MATRTKPAECCEPVAVKRLANRRSRKLAGVASALSDPNRIEILRLVARQPGPVCACDIVSHIDLSQPTVSHHLKKLKEAGLLRAQRQGLWSFYSVHPAGVGVLQNLARLLDKDWK